MNQFVKLEDFYKSLKDIKLINNSVDEKRELVKKYVSKHFFICTWVQK